MDNCLMRRYKIGEKRLIEWQIKPNSPNDTVVVTDARYELLSNDVKVKSGNVTVNNRLISHIFEAEEAGSFILRIYVTVPPETIETEVYIEVSE